MRVFFRWLVISYTTLYPIVIKASIADTARSDRYFHFTYENDFFTATDYYYTQGVRFEYAAPFFRSLPTAAILPVLKHSIINTSGIFLEQKCFTPTSIRENIVLDHDRPFAAGIYMGQYIHSEDDLKGQRLNTEAIAGVLGPCAVCEQEQKAIHKWLNNVHPMGWQFQLNNALILNYNIRYEKMLVSRSFAEFGGSVSTGAGTLYDNAAAGGLLRAGLFNRGFNKNMQNGLQARLKKFQLYAEVYGEATAVAYNATLEGGLLAHNSYTISPDDIERGILFGGGDITFIYGKITLKYSKSWITREFTYGLPHAWGSIDFFIRI